MPGAAATLTRSSRTPIPTPVRTLGPSPAVESARPASRWRSPGPSPSAAAARRSDEDEIAQVQQPMEQIVGQPDLPGMESLLLDHVSFSTPQGGSVMDTAEAAAWLRDHAGRASK